MDSVPQDRHYVMDVMWDACKEKVKAMSLAQIVAKQTKFTAVGLRRGLLDMELIGLVQRPGKANRADLFALDEHMIDLLKRVEDKTGVVKARYTERYEG